MPQQQIVKIATILVMLYIVYCLYNAVKSVHSIDDDIKPKFPGRGRILGGVNAADRSESRLLSH